MFDSDLKKCNEIELEHIAQTICDNYCKYPLQAPPDGKGDDWLMDDDSPCNLCPLVTKLGEIENDS